MSQMVREVEAIIKGAELKAPDNLRSVLEGRFRYIFLM